MLKKRWLNAVHVLSAHCPCLSGDVWRCQRWLGWRLFHVALHGSVLIELGHSPSSGGYVCDMVSQLATGCVTCHACHSCVTDFRPILGNPVEVTHVTSLGHVYIFPH